MLPSFDLPDSVTSPGHRVEGWFKYGYGKKSSSGALRLVPPTMVCGTSREELEPLGRLFGEIYRWPATTGSINVEEHLSEATTAAVTEDFFSFAFAGIAFPDRLYHAVRHEKLLKITKLRSTDIHFLMLPLLARTGQVFRPYFPKVDFYPFMVWAEKINYAYGLTSANDPAKMRLTQPRVYASDSENMVNLKCEIGRATRLAFEAHELRVATDVLDFLMKLPGVTTARHDGHRVLISHECERREVILNSAIFDLDYNEEHVRARIAKQRRMSREEVAAKFTEVLAARTVRHEGRFGPLPKNIIFTRTLLSLEKTITPKTEHHEPTSYNSDSARWWSSLIDFDNQCGRKIERVIHACRGLIGEGEVQQGGHEQRDTSTLGDLRSGVATISRDVERMRVTGRTLAAAGRTDRAVGSIREVAREFHGALHRLGRHRLGLPRSVDEVRNAVAQVERGVDPTPREKAWFANIETLQLQSAVWHWLKLSDADDVEELARYLRLLRDSKRPFDAMGSNGRTPGDNAVTGKALRTHEPPP